MHLGYPEMVVDYNEEPFCMVAGMHLFLAPDLSLCFPWSYMPLVNLVLLSARVYLSARSDLNRNLH